MPAGAGGMARSGGRVLSHGADGTSLCQPRSGARPFAPRLPSAARPAVFSATLPKCAVRAGFWLKASRRRGARSRSPPTPVRHGTISASSCRRCLSSTKVGFASKGLWRSSPNNAETFNNLGNTLKRLGQAAEAEKRWTVALEIKPDYAEAYSNLSNLLNDQGEYERAEAMARKALELNPRLADAYINLAGVASARHNYIDALGWLDALLAFAPMHGRALAARALTLKELDQLDEAMEAARCALAAAPEQPRSTQRGGAGFPGDGSVRAGAPAYDRAVTLPGPAQQDAVSNRASLFVEFGKAAEALRPLRRRRRSFPIRRGSCSARRTSSASNRRSSARRDGGADRPRWPLRH